MDSMCCGYVNSQSLMKILLRDAETQRFKGASDSWTSVMADAVPCASIEVAGEQALSFAEQDLEVVVQFEDLSSMLALNPAYCVRQLNTARQSSWRPSIAA